MEGPKGLRELVSQQSMADVTPEMFPNYRATMQASESEADIGKVGDYNEDTHVEYTGTAAWRWKIGRAHV